MAKEVITLSGVMEFFKDDLNSVSKGESKYKAGFVLELKITEFVIKAQVRASMKDKSYKVSLTVDGDGGISHGECDCPRGKWLCSLMAATSIYANKQGLSKTDLPNSWIAWPKKAAKFDKKPFEEYFPSPRLTHKATSRPKSEGDKEFLHNKLSRTGVQCPLKWICGPEPQLPEIDFLFPSLIEDLLYCFITDKRLLLKNVKSHLLR